MIKAGRPYNKLFLLLTILFAFFTVKASILFSAITLADNNDPFHQPLNILLNLKTVQSFNTDLLRGVFIVADPKMIDPNFSQTVVLLIHNEKGGSTGLIINRPTTEPISEKFPIMKEHLTASDRIFTGGPVLPKTLTILFQSKSPPAGMIPVLGNTYVSRKMSHLDNLPMATILEKRFRIFSGYAGWGPGQLQAEIIRGDWRVVRNGSDLLFEENTDIIWKKMLERSRARSVRNSPPRSRGETI